MLHATSAIGQAFARFGLFNILDSECSMPKATDDTCLSCLSKLVLSACSSYRHHQTSSDIIRHPIFFPSSHLPNFPSAAERSLSLTIEARSTAHSSRPKSSRAQRAKCPCDPSELSHAFTQVHSLSGLTFRDALACEVYKTSRFKSTNFAVAHYAGEVVYDAGTSTVSCSKMARSSQW